MKKIPILFLLAIGTCLTPSWAQTKTDAQKKPASTSKTQQKKPGTPGSKTGALKSKAGAIPLNKIDTFKLQVIPMVKFFESTLNFLSDKRNPVNEKQTIITQSYLKFCWDSEVQVEDDLDDKRLVPLYKDMPAYLSDVDFFFKKGVFTYSVQDVSVLANQQGLTYFKVTANRNLRGINLDGDSVNSNKVRYLELNYDSIRQELKIVSVYTTKLNEKDDLRNWWNTLSQGWKAILTKGMMMADTLPLARIDGYNDTVAVIGGQKIPVDGSLFYQYLGQIVHLTTLDISGNVTIADLEPVTKLSSLREVNISATPVSDLMPLRNLNDLESLNISNTAIASLDPLRYCTNIHQLRMKNTQVTDLSIVPSFGMLEVLDIGGTRVTSLDTLKDLQSLKDLRFDHTRIRELGSLAGLTNMELLNFSSTPVDKLDPLKNMVNLRILQCDSTPVKSLAPLDNLTGLQRVYCNHSNVTQPEALNFLKKHPDASLVYESETLAKWWSGIPAEWQKLFNFYVALDNPPTTEQLHKLVLIDSVNINGRIACTSLEPLRPLIMLRTLQCQSTAVDNFDPLAGLTELAEINAANTKVGSLKPMAGLTNLTTLNLDNTTIADLSPLNGLNKLDMVFADNTKVSLDEANRFFDKHPQSMLVFQTYENTGWWAGVSQPWKELFSQEIGLKGKPDKIQLQLIANLDTLVITENFQISDLTPVRFLSRLTVLQFSGTSVAKLDPLTGMNKLQAIRCMKNPINDLTPVNSLPQLNELDFSNTQVEELEPIQNMTWLEIVKFSGTPVKNLKYLQKLVNLKVLEFYNTRISSLDVLDAMSRLESLKIFNTKISSKRVEKFKAAHPRCEVVFY